MYGVSLKGEVERQPRWRKGVWFGEGEEEEFICQFCGGGRENKENYYVPNGFY